MKLKLKYLLYLIPPIITIAVIFFIDNQTVPDFKETSTSDETSITILRDQSENQFELVETQIIEIPEDYELKQTGWIPAWDFEAGFNSIREHPEKYYSISPVWYALNEDGSLIKNEIQKTSFLSYCEKEDIKVIPSIANFDALLLKEVLQTPENFTRHLDAIMEAVDDPRVAGIDIDYESIELEDKGMYMLFLKELSAKLHQQDKILSVSVIAQWGDDMIYPSLPQTRETQDWIEITKYADELRLMTYDYTSQHSPIPGPIAPMPWLQQVVSYALSKTEPTNIWLGVALYSYEWVNEKYDPNTNINNIDLVDDVMSNSYTFNTIQEILKDPSTEYTYNEELGEGIATYDCLTDSFCTMFYPTQESIQTRKDLASKYGLEGVAYWRIGREGSWLD